MIRDEDLSGHKTWRAIYAIAFIANILFLGAVGSPVLTAVVGAVLAFLWWGQQASINEIEQRRQSQVVSVTAASAGPTSDRATVVSAINEAPISTRDYHDFGRTLAGIIGAEGDSIVHKEKVLRYINEFLTEKDNFERRFFAHDLAAVQGDKFLLIVAATMSGYRGDVWIDSRIRSEAAQIARDASNADLFRKAYLPPIAAMTEKVFDLKRSWTEK